MAKNLAEAQQGANAIRGTQLVVGKRLSRAISGTASAADKGLGLAGKAILAPGGQIARGTGKAVGSVFNALKAHPGAAKLVAVGAPVGLLLREQAADSLTPAINEAVQEGRQVLANDKSFLEKKASLESRILEKTASLKKEAFMGAIAGAVGKQFLGSAGNMFGGMNNTTMGIGDTAKYQLNRKVNPLMDRVRADEQFAGNFFSSLGSESAKQMVGLLKDMAGKAMVRVQNAPAQHSMIGNLQQSDPMLAKADPETLSNAYHTMANFAPTLSTDENAVRSFLREAVMAGSGPDYATIANLAKAESTLRDTRK